MRVFVYEYLVALGIGRDPGDPFHPMYREGRAMLDAVAGDFAHVPDTWVEQPETAAEEDHENLIARAAGRCDWTVIIAPELGGELERCCWSVWTSTGKLLGPSPDAVRLTSDKFALADHWRAHGVPTPATTDRDPTTCENFPVVWKPRDGAGSTATFLLRDGLDVHPARSMLAAGEHTGPMILQEFVPGRAASVAFLCGPNGNVPLVPAFQLLSDDGRFKYLGGELPVPPELADRVIRIGTRAVGCVPGLLGYVGVDVVLGDAVDGSRDFAIEINPRLTTSYVGLRVLAEFNLAELMLKVAAGEPIDRPRWKPGRVRWWPDGGVKQIG
jgi:predicted ATP-grasp superfamily ATP-dependent carboligase